MAEFGPDSGRIHYVDEGSGTPLLIIPGWGGSIEELAPLRDALARSYRVIAADPPGSGRSQPQPRRYSSSYYHDDAALFLSFLEQLGASPAHVVGHSDGGEYALLMAIEQPAAVKSIVTWGSAGKLAPPPGMLEAWREVIDNPIPPLKDFSDYMKHTYGENAARTMVHTQTEALRTIVAQGGDLSRSRASEIACPALLITGEHDMFAPPGLVAELAGEMQNATFLEVKGAGHAFHHTNGPWLTRTIVDWLSKH